QRKATDGVLATLSQAEKRGDAIARELETTRTWLKEAQSASQSLAGQLDGVHRDLATERDEHSRTCAALSAAAILSQTQHGAVAVLRVSLQEAEHAREAADDALATERDEHGRTRSALAVAETLRRTRDNEIGTLRVSLQEAERAREAALVERSREVAAMQAQA